MAVALRFRRPRKALPASKGRVHGYEFFSVGGVRWRTKSWFKYLRTIKRAEVCDFVVEKLPTLRQREKKKKNPRLRI